MSSLLQQPHKTLKSNHLRNMVYKLAKHTLLLNRQLAKPAFLRIYPPVFQAFF